MVKEYMADYLDTLLETLVFPADFHAEKHPQAYLRILLQLPLVRRIFLPIKMSQEHLPIKIHIPKHCIKIRVRISPIKFTINHFSQISTFEYRLNYTFGPLSFPKL